MKLREKYQENTPDLIRNNTFSNEIVIVDGQGRSGKNMISVILSTMNRVEKMRLDSQLDYIPRYYFLGKMNLDAAIVALRTEVDEKLYYNMISRGVNFRIDDYTGVLKQGKRWLYFKRLFQKADQSAVDRIRKEKPIFQNMTHDGLHMSKLYFEAFGPRLKLVHVFRDPVGNIYEQDRRDFGVRMGKDPREFQLTHLWGNESVPIMAMGHEEDYLSGNPTERLVLIVDLMFRKNGQGFNDLDDQFQKQILFIEFEKFLINPDPYMHRLERFVGSKFTAAKNRIMKRERCPRVIDPKVRVERIKKIERNISKKYRIKLEKLIADYDERPWLQWNSF